MNDDFYHSEIDKPLLEARNKYISERWEQLYNVSTNATEEAQKYLFWVNSGGAVAVLGFIGANSEATKSWGGKRGIDSILHWTCFCRHFTCSSNSPFLQTFQ